MEANGARRVAVPGRAMKLIARHEGESIPVEVERDPGGYRLRLRGEWVRVDFITASRFLRSLRMPDGKQYLFVHHREGSRHDISFGDSTVQIELFDPLSMKRRFREDETDSNGNVTALMPGRVVRVHVQPGDVVKRGATLLVLEAMKMQNEITAPRDGSVSAVFVADGQTVDGGTLLLTLD